MSKLHAYTSCRHGTRDKMMMATPFFIFILIPLVIGGVFAWQKGGKAGKWILVFLGIFLVMLFVPYFFAHQSSPEQAYETSYPSQRSVLPGWYANVAREYEADWYPSQEAAVRALGQRMKEPIEKIRQSQSSQGHLQKDLLNLVSNNIDRKLLDAFREEIKEHTDITITFANNTSVLQPGDMYLQLTIQEFTSDTAPWNSSKRISNGLISASAERTGRSRTIHAQYMEKPWVEDFTKFQAEDTRRRNQRWIVGKSHNRARRSDQARGEVIEDGLRQLQPLVESRLRKNSGRQGWFGSSRPNSQEIQDFLRVELRGRIYVTDQFVQKFHRVHGGSPIYWEGMLINASDRNLELLAQRCAQGGGRQEWSWARTAGSAAGLLGLVCVVYLFLNLATRGYYVWVLRGTVVVILIVIVILFRFIG